MACSAVGVNGRAEGDTSDRYMHSKTGRRQGERDLQSASRREQALANAGYRSCHECLREGIPRRDRDVFDVVGVGRAGSPVDAA